MPKQTRGFWTCDFCSEAFDIFEDASIHEIYECIHRPPPSQHERPLPLTTGPSQLFAAPSPSYSFRRYLFMGHDSGRLTRDDAAMCRNIELFEVDTPNTSDVMGLRLALGTVGLRCIHCIGDRTAAPGNANFPRCVADIGDCLREIAEGHLIQCERTPSPVKQILQQALYTRQQAKQERGQAWFVQENSRRLLLDYCDFMARELRLVDRYPPNTGVVFEPTEIPLMEQHHLGRTSPISLRYSPTSDAQHSQHARPAQQQTHPSASATDMVSPARIMRDGPGFDQVPFGSPQFGTPAQKDHDVTPEPLSVTYSSGSLGRQTKDPYASFDSIPINFPFIWEPSDQWVCKFCQHMHPQYREPHYQWTASNKNPPPAHFIDSHLRICRQYQQNLMQDYYGPSAASPIGFSYEDHVGSSRTMGSDEYGKYPSSPFSRPVGGAPVGYVAPDTPISRAIAQLDCIDLSENYVDGTPVPDHFKLVANDDRLLLTDYYYYLMKQLRHCQFAENDRRTRGGKRDAVEIGYGGLQCVHCAKLPNARKFFWGNVDRLANSFAEIPTHILKCRACPKEIQDALLVLKEKHAEQMTLLPRGSQKVYFRRMWRRIHPSLLRSHEASSSPATSSLGTEEQQPSESLATEEKLHVAMHSPSVSEESVILIERSPADAARALADSALQSGSPSPTSRILLAIPNDKEWLPDTDSFVRQQVEVFCATKEDVDAAHHNKKLPIEEGTVGIRCIHCALSKLGDITQTYYPFSVTGLYEAVRDLHRLHLDICKNAPEAVRSKLASIKELSPLTSVGRNYYVSAAKSLGLVDTKHGIRASGESSPLSSRTAFSFEEGLRDFRQSPLIEPGETLSNSQTPRKRSYSEPSIHPFEETGKRQSFGSTGLRDINLTLENPDPQQRTAMGTENQTGDLFDDKRQGDSSFSDEKVNVRVKEDPESLQDLAFSGEH